MKPENKKNILQALKKFGQPVRVCVSHLVHVRRRLLLRTLNEAHLNLG